MNRLGYIAKSVAAMVAVGIMMTIVVPAEGKEKAKGETAKVFGQVYEADHLNRDSVSLVAKLPAGSSNETIVKVKNGEKLILVGMDGKKAIVEYEGQQYTVYGSRLRFVKDNDAGEGNVAQDEDDERYHSALGHLFHSAVPLVLIFLLLLGAGVMMKLVTNAESEADAMPRLWILMGLLLGACALEFGLVVFTDELVWWCDPKRMGFWLSALCLLPALVSLLIQVFVGIAVKKKLEELSGDSLSMKTAFLSIPLSLVLTLIVAMFHGGSGAQFLAFFGTMAVCIIYSWLRNGRTLGAGTGLAYTLFNFIYSIGLIIAIIILITIVWRLFLVMLPYLVIGVIVFTILKSPHRSAEPKPTGWKDDNGHHHNNYDEQKKANKEIEERREKKEYLEWRRRRYMEK